MENQWVLPDPLRIRSKMQNFTFTVFGAFYFHHVWTLISSWGQEISTWDFQGWKANLISLKTANKSVLVQHSLCCKYDGIPRVQPLWSAPCFLCSDIVIDFGFPSHFLQGYFCPVLTLLTGRSKWQEGKTASRTPSESQFCCFHATRWTQSEWAFLGAVAVAEGGSDILPLYAHRAYPVACPPHVWKAQLALCRCESEVESCF